MYHQFSEFKYWRGNPWLLTVVSCALVLGSCTAGLHGEGETQLQARLKQQLSEYKQLLEEESVLNSASTTQGTRFGAGGSKGVSHRVCQEPGDNATSLFSRSDKDLQDFLDNLGRSEPYNGLLDQGSLAITLVDLGSPCVVSAGLNEHQMFYAASIPKLVILLGLLRRFQEGSLIPSMRLLGLANEMIRVSSNSAASTLYNELGPVYLISLLFLEPYKFYDPANGGGLWIGKEYGGEDALLRDPLEGYSHAATSWQVARFYLLLERNQLLKMPEAQLMRRILQDPGLSHKFVKALNDVAPDATLLRKSGGWGYYQGDSVVVKTKTLHYILVALVKSESGESVLESIATRVHAFMKARESGRTS
jgi:beta-lactamase class A